jgi:hypothetical protein
MYFIKSFSVIAHIFGICKVYSHHWFLIFIYVSYIWNLKSNTHLFTLITPPLFSHYVTHIWKFYTNHYFSLNSL